MKHPLCTQLVRAVLPFGLALLASVVCAQQGGTASGTLTVEGDAAPASIQLAHAYYFTGPDSFDETNIERIIVFTADNHDDAIAACTDKSCAELSTADGLRIDISDTEMVHWWAHVRPLQDNGFADGLTLSADTPEHVVGTFRISGSGATTNVEFDATLTKAFDQ